MKLIIQGKNLEITDAIHEHVHQKIGKAMSFMDDPAAKVDVELSVPSSLRGQPQQIAEVTVFASSAVIRAEERHENLYASIDLVADKIARQLKRYKERYKDRSQQRPPAKEVPDIGRENQVAEALPTELIGDRTPELPPKVLRNKFFAMPAMSVEEALDNLQLVDHDFYVFRNAQTSEINVIYERNHGGYGVIQPRKES